MPSARFQPSAASCQLRCLPNVTSRRRLLRQAVSGDRLVHLVGCSRLQAMTKPSSSACGTLLARVQPPTLLALRTGSLAGDRGWRGRVPERAQGRACSHTRDETARDDTRRDGPRASEHRLLGNSTEQSTTLVGTLDAFHLAPDVNCRAPSTAGAGALAWRLLGCFPRRPMVQGRRAAAQRQGQCGNAAICRAISCTDFAYRC